MNKGLFVPLTGAIRSCIERNLKQKPVTKKSQEGGSGISRRHFPGFFLGGLFSVKRARADRKMNRLDRFRIKGLLLMRS
ncbi:conserved hypothetical protein [delta proteobacterium NaphS2]|nr:conserved hypothetical protein [delta proteobacterium NaphS2]